MKSEFVKCPHCNYKISQDSNYCQNCGKITNNTEVKATDVIRESVNKFTRTALTDDDIVIVGKVMSKSKILVKKLWKLFSYILLSFIVIAFIKDINDYFQNKPAINGDFFSDLLVFGSLFFLWIVVFGFGGDILRRCFKWLITE